MKKILIANSFGIGDVLFTSPLVSSIKENYPGTRVDYVCNARARELVGLMPGVERVIVYEKDEFTGLLKSSKRAFLRRLKLHFADIRDEKYDAVLDFSMSRESGFFFLCAGIPRRVGYNYRNRGIFLTNKIHLEGFAGKHVIEYYLELLPLIGIDPCVREMALEPDPRIEGSVSKFFSRAGMNGDSPKVAVIPGGGASWGASSIRKRWSPERFAGAADILENEGVRTCILGDSSEKGLCGKVGALMTATPAAVANGFGLKEYVSVLSNFDAVLCNDGGPLHIATALGVPNVSIFGPVDPVVYGPFPPDPSRRVLVADGAQCRPCYQRFKLPECPYEMRCMEERSPAEAAEACLRILRDPGTDKE